MKSKSRPTKSEKHISRSQKKLKKQEEAEHFISLLLDLDKNDHIGARCLL